MVASLVLAMASTTPPPSTISSPHSFPSTPSQIRFLPSLSFFASPPHSRAFNLTSSPPPHGSYGAPAMKAISPQMEIFVSRFLSSYENLGTRGKLIRARRLLLCWSSFINESPTQDADIQAPGGQDGTPRESNADGGGGGNGGGGLKWVSNALFFALWASLIFYAFIYSPNQTPYRDRYFLSKLVGLQGDDGFLMNQVLVCLFYIMGLWPLIYTLLLIPSGRSSKSGVPVWPFATISCFVGMFGLLPYFGLWQPPPPSIAREELDHWPLKVFESKLFAVLLAVSGAVIAGYALLAGSDSWKEFFRYFKESRFIHVMSLDFLGLSSMAPFWVYNDITVRHGSNKSSWFVPLALVPFFGPALYLVLRNPLPTMMIKEPKS